MTSPASLCVGRSLMGWSGEGKAAWHLHSRPCWARTHFGPCLSIYTETGTDAHHFVFLSTLI